MQLVYANTMKSTEAWKLLTWESLNFEISGRIVMRHNQKLQHGCTPEPGETLSMALQRMQVYCAAHKNGNPKITGFIKVVEHCKLNGGELRHFLSKKINQGCFSH
jgi:hypothetical protein